MKAPPSGSPFVRNFFSKPAFRDQLEAGYFFMMVTINVRKAITMDNFS